MKSRLLIVVGPTGVGKSELGIRLAESLNGEIISADSMQVYKHMDIGTAKITPEEAKGIPHHLIDIVEPGHGFTVAEYVARADAAIADIAGRDKLPIIVGGTGLYVKSLVEYYLFPDTGADWEYRKAMEDLADDRGNGYIHGMLADVDPVSAAKLHPNDRKRVIRALEVYRNTGKSITDQVAAHQPDSNRYETFKVGLTCGREELYSRIDTRVDRMMEAGLLDEVWGLMRSGLEASLTAIQALGYKESVWYFRGLCTLQEAVGLIKRESRRYAKRQLSWFRRDESIRWFDRREWADLEALATHIVGLYAGSQGEPGEIPIN